MLKVWVGLEARKFLQASVEDVRTLFLLSSCHFRVQLLVFRGKYANGMGEYRWRGVSSLISCRRIFEPCWGILILGERGLLGWRM